jgi:hypothetical protein
MEHAYQGTIALTAHTRHDANQLRAAGADIVLEPFTAAATTTPDTLHDLLTNRTHSDMSHAQRPAGTESDSRRHPGAPSVARNNRADSAATDTTSGPEPGGSALQERDDLAPDPGQTAKPLGGSMVPRSDDKPPSRRGPRRATLTE